MKRLIVGSVIAFGAGALVFGAIAVFSNVARFSDINWWSVNGVTPMWPLTVGYSSMLLMALSTSFLIVLAIIDLIRGARLKWETQTGE
ncbi:hypothetical protein [Salinibacterium sp. M195]|uniref:hypothetical protein n=1 Tax=Salinibacterium sp. M195 TaxID=2583374 RepID=UPI001C637338|nr:hypothetical protein [Salinibacterium sp. M195]QYH35542.1 hypothetical protein FFT87_05995 [Salinibacterium sp. M195]